MKQRYIMKGAHREMRGLEYLIYSALSLCLLIVLVFLPLAPVFADEIVTEDTSPISADIPVEEPVAEVVDAPEAVLAESETPVVEAPVLPENEPAPEEITETTTIPEVEEVILEEVSDLLLDVPVDGSTEEVLPPDEDTSEEVTPETPVEEGAPEVLGESALEEVDTPIDEVTPEGDVVAEEILEGTAPTTTVGEMVMHTATTDDNTFSFSKNECTTVGDGTFYCATASEAPTVIYTDRIFAAIDAEGDKEIYVEKNGVLSTITQNQMDDDAPYFDEVSNTVVWHRLIDGRYQIIQFDFDSGKETQLTNDRYNNMQPSAFGDAVVWQGWVGNDWEIFYETNGNLTMLTDNTTHDIAPSVNGTHIVWQSFEGDAWRMKVYDIRSGAIDTIEDAEGGSIENPRFVLVYDTKFESGDVETHGYDLKSGEVVHLASQPTSIPEEIPDPEQTGEERALVAPSTQPKQKTDADENDDVGTSTNNGLDDGDLVIPPLTDEVVSTSTVDIGTEADDVVIPLYDEGTTTSELGTIEDLVVEPYIPLEEVLEEEV